MRTSKQFSTISYNTIPFLKLKLEELITSKKISFYSFIYHLKEEDENKDHIHLFIEPSKMLQTDDLKDFFKEIDTDKDTGELKDKPLTCISAKPSQWGDWFLYCLHDIAYLASKGQTRKYHYAIDDFSTSDVDDFLERVRDINLLEKSLYQTMYDAIRTGATFAEFFSRGTVNLNNVFQASKAWDLLCDAFHTERAGRPNHEESTTDDIEVPLDAPFGEQGDSKS